MVTEQKKRASSIFVSEKGYSLLEILISVAIFSIGILGIAGLQVRATNTDTHSRLLTEAYTVATDQIEAIMLLPYSDATLVPGSEPTPINTGPSNRYRLWYTVTDNAGGVPPLPPANSKTISVFVRITASGIGFMDAANQAHVRIDFIKTLAQDLT